MSIDLYVEGGGDHNESVATRCRKGFAEFFRRAGIQRGTVSVIPSGSRSKAYADFRTAVTNSLGSHPILLVDSESPVADRSRPWRHVADREGGRWARPQGAAEDQLHFMAQAMEAWFYADKESLKRYYGQHLREAALGSRTDVEEIPKADLFKDLKRATKDCQKGEYSKGHHSFEILARIDSSKVAAASPYADRLLIALRNPA